MLILLTNLQDQSVHINIHAIISFDSGGFHDEAPPDGAATLINLCEGFLQYVKEAPDIVAARIKMARRDDELRHYAMLKGYERWRRQYTPGREPWNPEDA